MSYQLKNLLYGVLSGLLSGIVYVLLFIYVDKLAASGQQLQIHDQGALLTAHFLIFGVLGAIFALIFQKLIHGITAGIILGLIYGAVLWFIFALTFIPYFSGMAIDSSWNQTAVAAAMPIILGYLVFGFLLGLIYGFFKKHPLVRWITEPVYAEKRQVVKSKNDTNIVHEDLTHDEKKREEMSEEEVKRQEIRRAEAQRDLDDRKPKPL